MAMGVMKGNKEKINSNFDATKDFQKYWSAIYAAEPA
jgi:hypothetical protein